jgi:hypothetical protein
MKHAFQHQEVLAYVMENSHALMCNIHEKGASHKAQEFIGENVQ